MSSLGTRIQVGTLRKEKPVGVRRSPSQWLLRAQPLLPPAAPGPNLSGYWVTALPALPSSCPAPPAFENANEIPGSATVSPLTVREGHFLMMAQRPSLFWSPPTSPPPAPPLPTLFHLALLLPQQASAPWHSPAFPSARTLPQRPLPPLSPWHLPFSVRPALSLLQIGMRPRTHTPSPSSALFSLGPLHYLASHSVRLCAFSYPRSP